MGSCTDWLSFALPPLPPPAPLCWISSIPPGRGEAAVAALHHGLPRRCVELQRRRAKDQLALAFRSSQSVFLVGRDCMEKKMGEAVARVARKVNETVENKADSLDLADCKLVTFPIALYKVMRHVSEGIHLITLANNELKSVTSKFITTFSQLRELNLEGNCIHRLPEEVRTLLHLRVINLSRNKFSHFPEQLTSLPALETINLEENEIADVPVEKLATMESLQSVNLKSNPVNDEIRVIARPLIKFDLLTSPAAPRV
uniref:Leucine rich repeat containing 20 n=1 Tax=Podarcis muralis TaxID=64176 RepID=A0A670I8I4_PODMU|nr:leucine-rich repeat-containing protein 20-like isoform X5 [Podarcis muralis]